MEDKELIKKCKDGECICDGCQRRFICWTTKRVFSDPTHQALYEAYVAEGLPHDEAVQEVRETLERAIAQAAMRQIAEEREWNEKSPIYDKKKKWYNEWYDNTYPQVKWNDDPNRALFKSIGLDEAEKGIKDLQKYFRNMIRGDSRDKST
ncbi:MAG: hypothetical protein WC196_05990 [Bacilli bacterium]|jgi:hypothetical protein